MNELAESELDLGALSLRARELVLAAAMRERFRPSLLMADWLGRNGNSITEESLQEALDVTLALGAIGGGESERKEGTELPLPFRSQMLAAAGLSEVRRYLARETPRTDTERRFAELVTGVIPDANTMGRGDLLALAAAAAWAGKLDGVAKIDPEEITRLIANQEFVERVGGTDLSLFVGRETLLNALNRIWLLKDRPVVLIEGPGGIGKSIAVARFFQMLLANSSMKIRPDAILHLDFDLPNMQNATAFDMGVEIVRQLAQRWSAGSGDGFQMMLRGLGAGRLRQSYSTRSVKARSLEYLDWRMKGDVKYLISEAVHLFSISHRRPLKLVLFADSFERAEVLDEVAANNVSRIAEALKWSGADLMVIYAARSYLEPDRLADGRRPTIQRVKRFTQGESVDYLISKALQRGVMLTGKMASRANRTIKGWPLGLRIAVSMLGTSPETFDPDNWITHIENGDRSVQATLYERLLNRIQDEQVRKLAKPGLLVRRITAEVIQWVLAGPCGLPKKINASKLMILAEREGQLFWRDSSDPEALWHRQDLRELMLPMLRLDVSKETTQAIHSAAVKYYAGRSGDIARAEELYHRLCRGDPQATIEDRWQASAGQRLVGSLTELPPPAAAIVRLMLGGGRSNASSGIEELRMVALNSLSEGQTDLSGIFAQANAPESLFSPLGDVYAQSLIRQGRFSELLEGSERIAAARSLAASTKARIAISAAGVSEGMSNLTNALTFWRLALRLSEGLYPLEQLTVRLALARVLRKIGRGTSGRHAHVRAACDLLVVEAQSGFSNRVAQLEVVAEISEVLHPVKRWQERISPQVHNLLTKLFRELQPMFPSAIGSPSRLNDLAMLLGIDPADVHQPSDIDRLMFRYFNSPQIDLHKMALAALRSEVDAAFAAVVDRRPQGRPRPDDQQDLPH